MVTMLMRPERSQFQLVTVFVQNTFSLCMGVAQHHTAERGLFHIMHVQRPCDHAPLSAWSSAACSLYMVIHVIFKKLVAAYCRDLVLQTYALVLKLAM